MASTPRLLTSGNVNEAPGLQEDLGAYGTSITDLFHVWFLVQYLPLNFISKDVWMLQRISSASLITC